MSVLDFEEQAVMERRPFKWQHGPKGWLLTMALVGSLIPSFCLSVDISRKSYKAAVYEHMVIPPFPSEKPVSRADALRLMTENLAVYHEQAKLAKLKGADILVFPEDGIYGVIFTRQDIYPYLEIIPDPEKVTWSPCSDPDRFPHTEVQHSLSCMALNNSMYIVADMGDKIYCDITDPKCPKDGRYQYNTVVAYDPKGILVGKYHKRHLFYEDQFNIPVAQAKYFDTPFGRFGMVVCFDLLFYDPAVTLVTHHNVTNILFPTAWMDALPLLSAIGYHSSFARRLGVNFLSANIHLTMLRFHGSGIYTPKGALNFYYDNNLVSLGRLLVSEIDVINKPLKEKNLSHRYQQNGIELKCSKNIANNGKTFHAYLFHDLYKFTALENAQGEVQVCDGSVCCHLKYDKETIGQTGDLLALGAFDGLHTYQGKYYLQICTLVKCADSNNQSSCGEVTMTSSTKFKFLHLEGHFQTEFIFPQVISSNNRQLELTKAGEWAFSSSMEHGKTVSVVSSSSGFVKPVLSVTLFGRAYDRD